MVSPRQQAFTLIELLVVITIVAILGSLILAAVGLLGRNTDVFITKTRMGELQSRLEQADADDGRIRRLLQEQAFGSTLRFDSLRAVVIELLDEHGLDLADVPACDQHLPPGLASIYDDDIGCYTGSAINNKWFPWERMNRDPRDGVWVDDDKKQVRQAVTLDRVLVWRELIHFSRKAPFYGTGTAPFAGTPQYDDGDGKKYWHWWNKRVTELKPVANSNTERWSWLFYQDSTIGESLDGTMELIPDYLEDQQWYRDTWPILQEERFGGTTDDPHTGEFIQTCWPETDWDQAVPGSIRPVWSAPWGQRIVLRSTGNQHPSQYLLREQGGELRKLSELCPLDTIPLLIAAGVIPIGDDEVYRSNRNRERDFNDRWGNPLVISQAQFIAPRYYLDPAGLRSTGFFDEPTANPPNASHGKDKECHNDLLGGRDYLLRRCQEVYGFSQAAYLSVAAMGQHRGVYGDDNDIESTINDWTSKAPLTWTTADDDVVLRAIWLQATDLLKADRWDDEAMTDGPWDGTEDLTRGKKTALLTAPFTVH